MSEAGRMPRYDIRNHGAGPYAIFYCDKCTREYRSQPDVAGTIASDIGRQAASDTLRRIPLFGHAVADNVLGQDPRYTNTLSPQQLEKHWGQVKQYFRECPTCRQILCLSDFDEKSGFCTDDSPRANEIAQAQAEQAASIAKGFANVFGLGDAVKKASEAAQRASTNAARCPKDGTLAPSGTKFCPDCGAAMIQPAADPCPKCGTDVKGAKFCPNCGTKIERAAAAAKCPTCGAETQGAKFCPNCGAKQT
jgi:rubrerythrin